MADNRRMTTDRFYGGISNRLQNLRSMLEYICTESPPRPQLNQWIILNTQADSEEAVSHHLTFLESIELIELSEQGCELAEFGDRWLDDRSSETLYEALSSGVKGFDTLLQALQEGAMADEEIMELLVSEFEEAEMTKPGPAIRHREWLQVLGYVEREGNVNRLTSKGQELVETKHSEVETTTQPVSSNDISVGDKLSQEGALSNGLYLIPVNDEWRERFRTSVEQSHDLSGYEEVPPQLVGSDELRIWGTTETDSAKKQAAINQMEAGNYLLFYHDGDFIVGARVHRTFDSSEVGALIWGEPKSRHIYILDEVTTSVPSIDQVWDWLGYEGQQVVQGFTRVDDDRLAHLRQKYGSLQAALFGIGQEPTADEIEEEKSVLEEVVDSPPQLTENEEQYTMSRRRARDSAFARLVKETYGSKCAFCGSERETAKGNPEAEAAHIYPKEEGGSDDVRNGISLCKLHHWAFDTGWLSISDEYQILVKEEPGRNGYDEFKELEGDEIHLPEKEGVKPHPMFLAEHRQLNGFNDD